MSDFLQLSGKTILVFGVANKKSVAFHSAQVLEAVGARVLYAVRSESRRESLAKLLADKPVYVCDVEDEGQIESLCETVRQDHEALDGIVHSIAFGDYTEGMKPFHETSKSQFLRAVDISCYSLLAIARVFQPLLREDASVVAISISTTRMASESYGFMAPVKAALDSSLAFLAKSFSKFSQVRFNAVGPGLLKTSASAGIPGYVDSYLYAERVIPRGRAVRTEEVANIVAFLVSPRSSAINAQTLVADAAMEINYFDRDIVGRVVGG